MRTTSFVAFARRFFSNPQQDSDKNSERRATMAGWHHKFMQGVAAVSLGLVICGAGTMAMAQQAFNGQRIKPENIVGINVLENETNFIVNLSLCGGKQGTYLHVQTTSPLHDRVFAAWNMAVLNANNMDVWGDCLDTVHANLRLFGVEQ